MKWVVYNLLFALVFPLMLPGFLLRMLRRGGYRSRMGDRFALYPPDVVAAFAARSDEPRPVWIHAVSVGEVQVAGQLMREWRKAEPGVRFCFSTTSSTGWKMAEREVTERDVLIYNPLDFPSFVKSALKLIRPRAVILTESELWPNFILKAKKYGVPLFLINARVSDRSAPRYRKGRCFFKDVLSAFTRIFAQSELDRDRLLAAGAPEARTVVTGSFKFDVAHRNPAKESELKAWIGEGRILLGGSTWPGEDEVLLDIFKRLAADVPGLRLVLAPRHFEKADAVEANILSRGFTCRRRSRELSASSPSPSTSPSSSSSTIFLADTTGELMGLYGIADWVFVGKSLCEHGSQNMIEPCLCGKPTVVGPFTENFRPVMSDLFEGNAIVQVKDAEELGRVLEGWVKTGDDGLGARAAAAVERRLGVVPRCVKDIREALCKGVPEAPRKPRRSRRIWWILAVLALAVAGVGLWRHTHSALRSLEISEDLRFRAVRVVTAHAVLAECPLATTAVISGDTTNGLYRGIFERAGVCSAFEAREPDIVFAIGAKADWRTLSKTLVSSNGVHAWAFDTRKLTVADFQKMLLAFSKPLVCRGSWPEIHLWIVGENDWLLVGHQERPHVRLADMLDRMASEGVAEELVEASCDSLSELLANYVDTDINLMAAFKGDMTMPVRPEFFYSREIPDVEWIDNTDVDEDIRTTVIGDFHAFQLARRAIVEANMLALEPGKMDAAVEKWAGALARNPHDTMLLDRLYRLAVNARAFERIGNYKAAAKCYETMASVRPTDAAAMLKFGECLQALGEKEISTKAINKAKEMMQ